MTSQRPNKLNQFWQELRRRRVVRITTVYAAAAFVILELVSIITEPLKLPEWTLAFMIILLCVGFILAIILSWIYDITPEGIEKTRSLQETREELPEKHSRILAWKIATFISVVVIIGLVIYNILGNTGRSGDIHGLEKSIAVLPFEILNSDEEYAWFGDAMTDEIILQLQNIKEFRVISRTSTLRYKNADKTIPQIGEELGVNYLVEGTVQRQEDEIRIRVQVIRAKNEAHIWGNMYDNQWEDIFDIQSDVAKQIAHELKAILSPEEIKKIEKNPTSNLEAYHLYLKGRWFWNKWTEENIKKGMEYFNKAIELDPDFALAYAGLAQAYTVLSFYSQLHPEKAFPKAKAMALKALKIDNTIAEAHIASALVKVYYDWDWEGGENDFKKAIALNPENITAHHLYAYFLVLLTRYDEAMVEIQKALKLDPLNLITNRTLGDFYYHMRQYDKAEEQLIRTLEMDSTFTFTHAYLGLVYLQKSLCQKALDEMQKEIDLDLGNDFMITAWKGYVYGICGYKNEGSDILNNLLERSENEYIPPTAISWIYFALGESDIGFDWLYKAYNERDHWITEIKSNHFFAGIHQDPRYKELLERMKLY